MAVTAREFRVDSLLCSPWFYIPAVVGMEWSFGFLWHRSSASCFDPWFCCRSKEASGLYDGACSVHWWSCGNRFAEIPSCVTQESPVCSVVYGRFSRFSTVTLLLCFPTHFLGQVFRVRVRDLDCFLSASPVQFVSPAKVTVRRRKYRTRQILCTLHDDYDK
ncbi:hypothetical protein Bca101_027395 [Brassica carinata]